MKNTYAKKGLELLNALYVCLYDNPSFSGNLVSVTDIFVLSSCSHINISWAEMHVF
jgi:hypothetical protein